MSAYSPNTPAPLYLLETEEDESDLPESVDLIASGYEWICPKCDCHNDEIEVLESVTCRECEAVWPTSAPEGAYE